jgi:hypothetical protein
MTDWFDKAEQMESSALRQRISQISIAGCAVCLALMAIDSGEPASGWTEADDCSVQWHFWLRSAK